MDDKATSSHQLIPALEALTRPLYKAIRTQRAFCVALGLALTAMCVLEAYRLTQNEVLYVSLGPGIQRARPGTLDELYLSSLAIETVRVVGNVDAFSVNEALDYLLRRLSPEQRIKYGAMHREAAKELVANGTWLYTPSIKVDRIETQKTASGTTRYLVHVTAKQVFGVLDRQVAQREASIMFVIEPFIHQGYGQALITGLSWPNMLRSDGAVLLPQEG